MAARDEILEALRAKPAGLTTKELAPICPAADLDQFIVARVIAQLRQEKLVTGAPSGPRDGHTVFILNGQDAPPAQHPETPSAPTAPTTEPKEPTMSTAKQILDALAKHGPLNTEGLRKHVKSEHVTTIAGQLARDGKLDVDQSLGRGKYTYSLPGAAPKRAQATPPALRARPQRPAPAQPRPAAPTNGAADFAITAGGLLSIRKDEQCVSLDPAEYAALRQFTGRAEAIWKETI